MTAAAKDDEIIDEEIVDDDEIIEGEPGASGAGEEAARRPWRGPSPARWALFVVITVAVVVVDQVSKNWLTSLLMPGEAMVVIPGWLNFVHGQNSGILFGMLPQSAFAFAIVSLVVTGLIVVYHAKAGRGIVTTVALALLLGGAIGNLLDRLNHGYVVDWIDMGIGSWRFWTYNVADACITTSILLLILMAVVPRVGEWGADD